MYLRNVIIILSMFLARLISISETSLWRISSCIFRHCDYHQIQAQLCNVRIRVWRDSISQKPAGSWVYTGPRRGVLSLFRFPDDLGSNPGLGILLVSLYTRRAADLCKQLAFIGQRAYIYQRYCHDESVLLMEDIEAASPKNRRDAARFHFDYHTKDLRDDNFYRYKETRVFWNRYGHIII